MSCLFKRTKHSRQQKPTWQDQKRDGQRQVTRPNADKRGVTNKRKSRIDEIINEILQVRAKGLDNAIVPQRKLDMTAYLVRNIAISTEEVYKHYKLDYLFFVGVSFKNSGPCGIDFVV